MPAEAQAQLDKLQDALKATLAGDETTEARELNKIGELYYRTSNYENALEYYNRALIPARSAKDAEQEAAALSGIGSCYRD
jgi:tetratricopeptide (TPR) repeat protein